MRRATGSISASCPSGTDGRAWISDEQNGGTRPHRQTLAHFLPFPFLCATREWVSLTAETTDRWATQCKEGKQVSGAVWSPSPVCVPAIGWTRHRRVAPWRCLSALVHTDEAVSAGYIEVSNTSRSHKRRTDEISSPTTRRRAVVRVLLVWRVDPRPAVFHKVNSGKNLIPTHSSSVCYPNHLLLLSTWLDLRSSMALDTNIGVDHLLGARSTG
jgi:hypothetical protein